MSCIWKLNSRFIIIAFALSTLLRLLFRDSIIITFSLLDISEWLVKDGALALVDKEEPWDMHRPLERDCNVNILTFSDPLFQKILNRVFWRSCSFLLGAVIQDAFRSDLPVYLHSFPSPRGQFVYTPWRLWYFIFNLLSSFMLSYYSYCFALDLT